MHCEIYPYGDSGYCLFDLVIYVRYESMNQNHRIVNISHSRVGTKHLCPLDVSGVCDLFETRT